MYDEYRMLLILYADQQELDPCLLLGHVENLL